MQMDGRAGDGESGDWILKRMWPLHTASRTSIFHPKCHHPFSICVCIYYIPRQSILSVMSLLQIASHRN